MAFYDKFLRPELFTTGSTLFPVLLEAIGQAKEEILIAAYELKNDATCGQFIKSLGDAAARGVRVRVLFDNVELVSDSTEFIKNTLYSRGVAVCVFRPLRTWLPFHPLIAACRNHARFVLIDKIIFGCGGMSFTDVSLTRNDIFLLCAIRMPPDALREYFEKLLALAEKSSVPEALAFKNTAPICAGYTLLASGPEKRDQEIYDWLDRMCDKARHAIVIGTPFFFPDTPLLHKLAVARSRGVHVEVITPLSTDKPRYDWFRAAPILWLVARGVQWLGARAYFHSKFCIVDTQWTFGSANIDIVGTQRNYELNACGDDALILQKLHGHAKELTLHAVDIFRQPMPRSVKLLIRIFHPLAEYIFKLT